VAAFNLGKNDFYISSGSWFLAGCLSDRPLLSREAYSAGLTNERAADGRFRVLKNITGLYLMQECEWAWRVAGEDADTISLVEAASAAKPFGPLINPDDPSLAAPGNMPRRIAQLLEKTNQGMPVDKGAIIRCILESIAIKCAIVLERICDVAGMEPVRLHIGGGGARNELLCGMLAGATGLEVVAGPVEAAAVGNIIVQAESLGSIGSIKEGAGIAGDSLEMKTYRGTSYNEWKIARERYIELFGNV
jgi:sugar (pentulose or hexulose) kinase